jgi:uncharacterized protein
LEDIFQLYLPIAEMRISMPLLVLVGLFVGTLAGMLGLGGGLIAVPLLTALQIPPSIAVATATNQMTAASFSGYLAYARRGRVDYKLGSFLIIGGLLGSYFGIMIFRKLTEIGKIDLFISLSFMIFLGITASRLRILQFSLTAKSKEYPGQNQNRLYYAEYLCHCVPISLARNEKSVFYPR